jgi:prefoldin alpha subunit
MEEPSQELMVKLQMFDQQIQQLQQQTQAVEQGIAEMTTLSSGLDELAGKKGKEIFAPIGRGIFARAKLESEDLNVDIGGGNFVKKSIPETKKIIGVQIKKLENVKKELYDNLEKVGEEFNNTIVEAQAEAGNGHVHDENCEHSDKEASLSVPSNINENDSEGKEGKKKEVKKSKGKKIDELV